MNVKDNNSQIYFYKKAINEIVERCDDVDLLDFVFQFLVKSGRNENSN